MNEARCNIRMLNISSMKFQSEELKDLCLMLPVIPIFLSCGALCVLELRARRFFRGVHIQPRGSFPKLLSRLPPFSTLPL